MGLVKTVWTGKRGGFVTNLFSLAVLFLVWVFWLAGWLKSIGWSYVVDNNLSGIPGFLLSNINLFIFFGFLIGTILIFRAE